jgi:integration host factor subunit beta
MVRSELIEVLAAKAGLTNAQAGEIVGAFFDAITESITTDGRVELRGFGAFAVRKYRSYEGRNPKTSEPITVPEKKLPFWKTGLELRQRVDRHGLLDER